MKKNGNNLTVGNYYLGLDVGTNSVGWAVTDKDYNVLKFKGKAMWGVRLFDEAQDASTRRTNRINRRRLARRNQRLFLLDMLFAEEIAKVDPMFLTRVKESALHGDDRTEGVGCFSLFNDAGYTDREYYEKYPTVYHLQSELIHSKETHDVRLVYLALHHLVKNRGHHLHDGDFGDDGRSVESAFEELQQHINDQYGIAFEPKEKTGYVQAIRDSKMNITEKKKALRNAYGSFEKDTEGLVTEKLSDMLSGAKVSFADLFADPVLKDMDTKSLSLSGSIDEVMDELEIALGDRLDLILQMKKVYDAATLSKIIGDHAWLCDAKVALYEKNRKDLSTLKEYVKLYHKDLYSKIFTEKKDKLNNYAAYSGYKLSSGEYHCNQEEFCSFLASELEDMENREGYRNLWKQIKDKTLLPRLRGVSNGVIPCQINRKQLVAILDNACGYLPFLGEADEKGITAREKLIALFDFTIPYYVGPLSPKATNKWVVRRSNEKIYPWNFNEVVDVEASAEEFIINLIGRCTYTGEDVLPKNSLLYSEYCVLNEINPLKVNGQPVPTDVKGRIFEDLFVKSKKKVTKKRIKTYLVTEGLIDETDEISGVDDIIKSNLKSWHDFQRILEKTNDRNMVESIIRGILIFGDDKKMLRKWLKKNTHDLDEDDIQYISRLKYSDWGNLSKEFLTDLYSPFEYGEAWSIMDFLRNTNYNLMQLLSSDFNFSDQAETYRKDHFGNPDTLNEKLDALYISPSVRRSVRQTLKITDELVDIMKSSPKKIFIEVAREHRDTVLKKRTISRKEQLQKLYEACGDDCWAVMDSLESWSDNDLRRDKLFLYYLQCGRCMYSGEIIDLDSLLNDEHAYDIDHIFPRSRIKDDSLDNRVLVKSVLNREKTNIYPIEQKIREKRRAFWYQLKEQGFISAKKYDRLVRNNPLTEKELSDFVARQMVETQQSTKALATIMKDYYSGSKIVYSKAGNVSEFRQKYDLLKCRDVNDLHHAKDAYLNVVVGNVYDTKFTEQFFKNILSENYNLNKVFEFDTLGAWDKTESIKTVRNQYLKNNVVVTRMPIAVKGQLYDLQIMAAGKGQLSVKSGMEISKYGGYNKLTGSYFFVVEHKDKKDRVCTIEPVFLYKKELYEKNPLNYCKEVLNLQDAHIVIPKVLINQIMEIDGKRMGISGRTGNQIIYQNVTQLVVGQECEKYIRNVLKYLERCTHQKKVLDLTERDGITAEDNLLLYNLFIEKTTAAVYSWYLSTLKADLVDNKDKFEEMGLHDQCATLAQILKAFKCDAQHPDLKRLCGKGSVGHSKKSKKLNGNNSVAVVHQSVTGLFEHKEIVI